MKSRLRVQTWLLIATVFFIIGSARSYTTGDTLGASVLGVVALVFLFRFWLETKAKTQ